jgi:hypothetical protein
LACDKPTSKAIDYLEYRDSLEVVWENAPLMLAGSDLPLTSADSGATIADTAASEGQ